MTGEQLRAWRYQHAISQAKLARALQVTVLTIKRWESGYQAAPGFLDLALERLAQKLGRTKKATS